MLWALHRLEEFNWNDTSGKDKATAKLNPFYEWLCAKSLERKRCLYEATRESGASRGDPRKRLPAAQFNVLHCQQLLQKLVHNVLNAIDGRHAVGHEQNSRMSSTKGITRVPLASLARSPRHSTFLPGHPAYRALLPQRWSSSLSQKPGSAG
jgi:hypothetical protein